MSIIRVPTSFNIDLEFEMAEFHRRLIAWLIDVIIILIYFFVMRSLFISSLGEEFYTRDEGMTAYAGWLLILLPIFLYHPLCEIFFNGRSIGKMVLGIRVVDEEGGRPSVSQYIIRWLIRAGDWAIILIILVNVFMFLDKELLRFLLASFLLLVTDIVLVIVSKKSQRLGDMLAHTIVVSTKARGSMSESVFMEIADNYVPVFPQIMHLSDRDINAIKTILDTARKKSDFNLAATASEKIKNHLKIETSLSPFDFLDTLLKDYNYLSVK
jgi:uncharacterized RDD family membrane protein YckC